MLQAKNQSKRTHVPLKRVSVEATIRSFAADVTITQVFRNDETTPIEAVYCFPIEEQAAVYAFRARIDDREIVAELKEKDDAQRAYNEALRQGHGAYLLEQDEKSLDNFIVNVGALSVSTECHVTISYVTELDLVENGTKIRFVVPETIAPRYNPNVGGISAPAGTTSEYVQSSPYTIEFHCRVEKIEILRISSLSHPIQISVDQDVVYVVEFAQQDTSLDRDILLDIELAENHSNTIVAVESGAIMASFTPTKEDCRQVMNTNETTNEFIFLVDCSGSMGSENKIELVREAMLLFLKSLPVGCHFNIILFGSTFKNLFDNITAVYDQDNVKRAESLIKYLGANLGGTELLLPLFWLNDNPPKRGHSRQIFLLTDGEIANVDEVLNLCSSMSESTRIFSFGLGLSPSRSLVKGLARATNGRSVFIPPYTYVDSYVGEQLQKALQPCITNVEIKWNSKATITNVVPTKSPPVYVNDRIIVYAFLGEQSTSLEHGISVELYSGQHRLGEAHVNRIPTVSNNQTIARLATKALILELQHEKSSFTTREKIAKLSLRYNILSQYTAFVGIEKRVNASNADMVLREVPIQISADDEHLLGQQLCYSQMSYDKTQYHQNVYQLKHAQSRLYSAQMNCRRALEDFTSISYDLSHYQRQAESLREDFYKSLNFSQQNDETRSFRTHDHKNDRRSNSKLDCHSFQMMCRETRMRWLEAWDQYEIYRNDRDDAISDYYKAVKEFRSYGYRSSYYRRDYKADQYFKAAQKFLQDSQQRYHNTFYRMMNDSWELRDFECEFDSYFRDLDDHDEGTSAVTNTSTGGGSHAPSAADSQEMRSARSVDNGQRDIVQKLISKINSMAHGI
ncbi:unnamed protein product [Rotaria magnacalcarata]|uniref:Uncharacterized protein n=1 Tax=Rotaria magnacalcarata TaxID=392030 RepID=A0A816WAZ0_9BILA|nr:unnamed protein product [Rotaria magnacalcarata]CAF3873162.1 unnamed protein product [Rotaria magnacalcarata]